MSLTITISDAVADAAMDKTVRIGSEVVEARKSIARGEVKITLGADMADWVQATQSSPYAIAMSGKVLRFRAELQTPYRIWLAALDGKQKLAWEAMQTTHEALKGTNMHNALKNLRKLAVEEFGEVCLEGLPE